MGNIVPKVGIEPTSLAIRASVLTITQHSLPWCHYCTHTYLAMQILAWEVSAAFYTSVVLLMTTLGYDSHNTLISFVNRNEIVLENMLFLDKIPLCVCVYNKCIHMPTYMLQHAGSHLQSFLLDQQNSEHPGYRITYHVQGLRPNHFGLHGHSPSA